MVWAGGPEIAAALPNEAAECRYLAQKCDAMFNPLNSENFNGRNMDEAVAIAKVILAKHAKRPKCIDTVSCKTKAGMVDWP